MSAGGGSAGDPGSLDPSRGFFVLFIALNRFIIGDALHISI
jgi:hypothetical protein